MGSRWPADARGPGQTAKAEWPLAVENDGGGTSDAGLLVAVSFQGGSRSTYFGSDAG